MGGKKWSDEEVIILTKHYGKCHSRMELLQKLPGRSYDAISMKAFFLGLKGNSRNSNRQYDVWFDAFSELTSDAAYWAGFLAADGHITPKGQLKIKLSKRDHNHLSSLVKYLRYTGNTTEHSDTGYKGQPVREVTIASVDICRDLQSKFNIPAGKKSDILHLPNIKNELLIDYITGYFDGDGCMYHDKRGYLTITFVGNKEFLEEIRMVMNNYFKINTSHPYKNTQHSDAHLYRIHGEKAKRVLDRFAQNKNSMKRKRLSLSYEAK